MADKRWAPLVVWGVALAMAVGLFRQALFDPPGVPYLADLLIYRESIVSAAAGGSLFDYVFHHYDIRLEGYGFTYPPSAALVLWPLAWIPGDLADRLWTLAGLLTTACVGLVVAYHFKPGTSPRRIAVVGGLCAVALLASYPVVSHLLLGQVSLFVTALSVVDAVVVPRRWRGWLTAIAGAVKLLPLAFVGYFLLTKQWAAAARAMGGFAAITLLALLVLPADSVTYWTQRVWQTGNVGDPSFPRNRAVFGLIARWWGQGTAPRVLWLVLTAVLVLSAAGAVLRHHKAGETLRAATVMGCLVVAAFPISWTHYLTWAVISALLMVLSPRPWPLAGLLAVVALSLASPIMQEDAPTGLFAAVGREIPGLFVLAVAALGLPHLEIPDRQSEPETSLPPSVP